MQQFKNCIRFLFLDMFDYKLKIISQSDLSPGPFWIAGDKDPARFESACMDQVADKSLVVCFPTHHVVQVVDDWVWCLLLDVHVHGFAALKVDFPYLFLCCEQKKCMVRQTDSSQECPFNTKIWDLVNLLNGCKS